MPVNLFTFVDLYTRVLDTAAHILKKGVEHAKATGVTEQQMLDWRLIDDMQPLRFQLMVVCNFTKQWTARVVGLPLPEDIGVDLSVTEFQKEIAASRAYLGKLTAKQFEGRDDVPLTVSIGGGQMEPTFPAAQWLTVFATTNIYFHMSTAYGILRSKGVQIGKLDLFSTGL
jgi:hypothetical protein